jgi:Flp pilus assembly protein TadD
MEKEELKTTKKTDMSTGMSVGIRLEASLLKLKRGVDNLVDLYCRTTSLETNEAEDLVSQKAIKFMEKGHYGKAIDEFNRLIGLGKKDPAIYYRLGVCCEKEYLDEEAEKAYKKALDMDKGCLEAIYKLGMLAIKNDDPKTGVKYLSELSTKDEPDFKVVYQLGVAYDKMKDFDKAITMFKKAIKTDPEYPKTYKRLGYSYDSADQHEEAVACFKKAMEIEEI